MTPKQKEEAIRNEQSLAGWHCALALEGVCDGGPFTMEKIAKLMQASFNAGKAIALYRYGNL